TAVGARRDLRGRPAARQGRTDRAAPDRALRSHPLAQTERFQVTTEPAVAPTQVTDVVSPDHAQHLRLLEALIFAGTQARDEIEQVRGVGLSKGTLDLLFEQNWIRPMGRRRAPGKPVTWGTTDFFLEHFGLPALDDLPGHEEMKAAGLLDPRAQPPIYRPEEPDLPLEAEEDEADEPLATE